MSNFWKWVFELILTPGKHETGFGLLVEKCLVKYFSKGSKRG